jgi:hypothetical protein
VIECENPVPDALNCMFPYYDIIRNANGKEYNITGSSKTVAKDGVQNKLKWLSYDTSRLNFWRITEPLFASFVVTSDALIVAYLEKRCGGVRLIVAHT